MSQLFLALFALDQFLRVEAEFDVPIESLINPLLMQLGVGLLAGLQILRRFAEVFDLHLLELARAKSEIARRDFVAERFADLRDTERQLAPHRLLHVSEIGEDALRCFGAQVSQILVAFDGTDRRLEHQVEIARFGQVGRSAAWTFAVFQVVGAAASFAFAAINQRVAESRFVARITPDQTIHQNRGVQTFHVVAFVNDRTPPRAHDVVFQFNAQRAVIPGRGDAAVNFRVSEDKAASFAQAHDLFHAWR
ncbi:MAG: hypothetical protein JMDDDDMK_02721 [Acidobacteria bacterium]|nr:hypothetical protein [Acidobacteriota bacterium]